VGRILAVDYGLKRTGLAATDPLKIIASPLETVLTEELIDWIKRYVADELVESIVVGFPTNIDQSNTHSTEAVLKFVSELKKAFPSLPIHQEDERFTSRIAQQAMVSGGMKKKKRRQKGSVDKISATIILQSFLEKQGK